MNKPESFNTLANVAQTIKETRSTNAKIAICARYFASFDKVEELKCAAQFLGEGAFSNVSGKRAGIGSRTISTCAAAFCGIDYELVFKPCRYATGSASEAIEKLMQNTPEGQQNRTPHSTNILEIKECYEHIYNARGRVDKQAILREVWRQMTPVEIKYFIRIMGRGSLRIGFEIRSVLSAIAKAFDQTTDDVRYVHMITGSVAKTVAMCFNDELEHARFVMFQPLSFMLASPIESRKLEDVSGYVAEEKFDGMRCQLHVDGPNVKLFSRDLNDITQSFPELVGTFQTKKMPKTVLDGEICVFKDNRIQPFQLLQKRMGVKKPTKKILNQYPVLFVGFDLLYLKGSPLFNKPLTERRSQLEELSTAYEFPVTKQLEVTKREDIELLFNRALEHGNEGLMLKKIDSVYEYGQRRKSWLKVKKPGGTLDTVMMYAHAGSGKRGGYYSDFTLGIRVAEDDRYEEEFIPIGKAYGGYTDDEMKKMNKKIKELTVEKYGPTLGLIPEIVIELEFDDIQVNKRTKANYTLRLPRFKAIRWDLGPKDVDKLNDVERLYQQKIDKERTPQSEHASFIIPTNTND